MSRVMTGLSANAALADAHVALDELVHTDLALAGTDELLGSWRELERLRNRLASIEHGFVAEAERRGLPFESGARNMPAFLRSLLRLHPRDAVGRVRAADAAAARIALSGEPLPAPYSHVAAAQATGELSPRQAQVIVDTVEKLPDAVQAVDGDKIEAELVGYADQFDPHLLGKLALRIRQHHDPDGVLDDAAYRERHRDLTINQRPDGSASIHGEATAELAERFLSVLDALAAPKPAAEGTKDPRTAGQRRHDALLDTLELLQRAGELPATAGISTTILLTTSSGNWQGGTGTSTTGHGATIPTSEGIRWAGGDARVMTVECDEQGGVTRHTDTRRLFTENQRLAMAARDGGCSFPGCDTPIAWTQAHHITEWADGGPTTIDNGTLICGHDHRERIRQGWTCRMIDSRPAWVPPIWIDPDQRPRYNTLHNAG